MSSRHTQSDENRPTLKTPRLRAGGWSQTPAATPAPSKSMGKTPGRTPGQTGKTPGNDKEETGKTPVRGLKTPTAKSTSTSTSTTASMSTAATKSTSSSASVATSVPTPMAATRATASKPTPTQRTPLRPRPRPREQENPFAPAHDDGGKAQPKGKGKRAADDAGPATKRRALAAVGENTPVPNKAKIDTDNGTTRKPRLLTPAVRGVKPTPSTSTSTSTSTARTRRTPTPSTSTSTPTAKPQPKPARRPALTRASTADILARPLGPDAYTTPAPGRRRKPPVSGLTGLLGTSSRRINVRPDEPAFEDVAAARGIDLGEIEGSAGGGSAVDPPYDPPTPPRGREEEALYAVLEEPEIELPDLPPSPHFDLPDLPDLDFVL